MPLHPPRSPAFLRRIGTFLRILVTVISCLAIAGSVGLLGKLIIDPNGSEEFTVGRRPMLFQSVFDNDQRMFPDSTYADVIGVAHNSGGRIESTLEAIIFGADVIEVDVVEIDGELYAAHTPPIPFVGSRWFRGPSLERIWTASYRAEALKLDLKETSPAFVDLVAEFLVTRPGNRDIIVASRSPAVLTTLRERAPEAILLLSVPDTETFTSLQGNEALQQVIDGVTVRESVIDASMVYWLTEHDLRVNAWTVNDVERVNELIQLGVTSITTENLAILTLLGTQPVDQPGLVASPAVTASDEANDAATEDSEDERPGESHLYADVDETNLDEDEVVEYEEREQHGQQRGDHEDRQSPVGEEA